MKAAGRTQDRNDIRNAVYVTTKITNVGKTSAAIVQARHTVSSLEDKCRLETQSYKLGEMRDSSIETLKGKNIFPSQSISVTEKFPLRSDCIQENIRIISDGSIEYADPIGGTAYTLPLLGIRSVPTKPASSPSTSP